MEQKVTIDPRQGSPAELWVVLRFSGQAQDLVNNKWQVVKRRSTVAAQPALAIGQESEGKKDST